MTIENLGVKLYSGTKSDRKSDSLGSSADGTNTGIVNQNFSSDGIYLDGGNVDFTATGLFDGTGDFSIAFWVKPTDVSSNRSLFYTNGTGSGIFQVFYTTSSGGTWRINLNGSDDVDFALTLNSWNHVVITKTSVGVWTVYVNKTAGTPVTNNVTLTSGTTYRLGQSYDASYPEYYKGYIQQFLIYDDVLTQTEVNTLYDLGRTSTSPSTSGLVSQYNLTSNANDSQGSNNGTASAIKLGTGAYSFDGSDDYVSIDDSSANLIQGRSSAWTIAGWLKRDGSTDKYFISQWGKNSSPDNRVFHIGIDSNGKLLYRQRTDGGQGESFTSNNAITDKTWTHFAIVWQPNGSDWQAQMYINGTADNSKTDFGNDMRGGSITEPVYLGKNGSDATSPSAGGDYFNGELDDLAVWHRVLTASSISDLATPQGNKGGTHVGAGTYGACGGGGAGAVGEPDTSSKSGNGGAGKANPITGSEVGELSSGVYYLAGGGGGGAHSGGTNSRGLGGLGGGGNGGDGSNEPENGTANTGGGAGGDTTAGSTTGMTGGTGVVIITYQTSEITSASGGTLESGSSIPSGYAVRKFTSNGTFQISAGSGNVQYVIVAGGGGSGSQVGGGGGAGGFVTGTKSMSSGSYTVTIGAGGTGANTDTSTRATNGTNSVFDNVTALGGGFGADNDITPYMNGNYGGSGGGGTYRGGAEDGGSGAAGAGALVSSLTNKSELKANYTMDTEGTTAYGTSWTQENNHNISSEENQVRALGMSHDGLYAFVAGDENGKIIRYALGTAWDLSSITGTPVQATIDSNPRGMAFNADGTLIFILYSGGTLKKYSPDSAYDIATLGSADQTKTSLGSLVGLHFKPDGTEFYSTLGSTGVKQFTLGSAWDISGATGGSTKAVSGENDPTDVWISSDGTKMFVCGYGNDEVVKYTMPAWDIGNSTADSTEFGVPANPFGLVLKPDGTKFILAVDDTTTDKLYEYAGGKSCPNDFSTTSDLEALSGIRTSSIFQQTDDTPSYWWYSGSAWLLDGTTQIIPTGTWNSSGYTNHSSFTQDSGKITYTCSSGSGQNGGAVASYDLGSGFDGDTNFIFRFRIKYTNQSDVSQANTSFSVGIGKEKTVTSSQGIFNSTDQIMWRWAGANNDEYRILTNVDGSNYQSSGQSFTPSTDTYYYFEIVRSGATSFTMNRYSDDTYKTVSDSESTTSAGNPNSLRYIQMGTSYDHQIGSWVAEVDEMKIQSGVSEWLE